MNAFDFTNETKNYRSLNYFKKYKNQNNVILSIIVNIL